MTDPDLTTTYHMKPLNSEHSPTAVKGTALYLPGSCVYKREWQK
jgi:hypothetical protein